MKPIRKSVLLKTSTISDVQHSGGILAITGCLPIKDTRILDIKQIKYKAEVRQITKIAFSGYTPTANTTYKVVLDFQLSTREGYTGVSKEYSYTTPAVLTNIGATAALQREYIHANIIAKIMADNASGAVPVTAVTIAAGNGINLTDDAGYYPARIGGASNGRKGPTNVYLVTNADGSGWVDTVLENIVTTAGVISFGEGQRLLDDKPTLAAYTQNLTSGELDAPVASDGTYAVAGQHYDAFIISALTTASAIAITGQLAYQPVEMAVFVDNGTGGSTTNLTGFIAFEKAMHRELFALYKKNPSAIVDFFDNLATYAGSATPAPIGTDTSTNVVNTGVNTLHYYVNNTATILAPYVTTNGIPLSLDATDNEGMELSAPVFASCPKEFIVGSTECAFYAKINLDDISGTDAFYAGFRKKEAYQAVPDNYNDMATLSLIATAGLINMSTILAGAATTNTSTAVTWVDTETHDLEVRVLIDGTCKFYIDSVEKTQLQATGFKFAAGTVLIPFISFLNSSDVAAPFLKELAVVPSAYWKL